MSRLGHRAAPSLVLLGLVVLLGLAACTGPGPEPLDEEAWVELAIARGTDELAEGLAVLGELPAVVEVPEPGARSDPLRDGYWHARVLAFDPELRQLRHELAAAAEAARSAGAPLPISVSASTREIEDVDREAQLGLTLELFSLLGLGPSGAEAEAAATRVRVLALGFEAEVRQELFLVDRLRVQLWSKSRERELHAELLQQAAPGLARVEAAHEFGVLGPGLHGRARGVTASLREAMEQLDVEMRALRERLAMRGGLLYGDVEGFVPDGAWFEDPLASSREGESEPSAAEQSGREQSGREPRGSSPVASPEMRLLLQQVPELRTARLRYALREAELRSEVAAQWPRLRLGPSVTRRADEYLWGGVLALEWPFPGALSGRIAAAAERRAAARDAVADLLLEVHNSVLRADAEQRAAFERARGVVRARLEATETAWRSARARVWTSGQAEDIKDWIEAMQYRISALLSAQRAHERVLLATLDLRAARGDAPGLDR